MKKITGFSLIELMIAITLGLIMVAIIAQIYVGSKQTYRTQDDLARLQEEGRYAMELISRSLRLAGYQPDFTAAYATKFVATKEAIGGTAGATSNDPDTLIVRHYGSGVAGTPDNSIRDCTGTAVDGVTQAQMTFSVASGELQCQSVVGTAAATTASLTNNVRDIQILYGVDTSMPADRIVDIFQSASPAPTWDNVLAVRICIEMQTANDNVSPANQTYTKCNGDSFNATDRRFHRTFSTTIALRNRLP